VDYAKFEDNNPCIPHEAQPLLFQNDGFQWAKSYTTNVDFFEDTQVILKETELYKDRIRSTPYAVNCDTILAIMDDTTNNVFRQVFVHGLVDVQVSQRVDVVFTNTFHS
jgi:hypothetical protein